VGVVVLGFIGWIGAVWWLVVVLWYNASLGSGMDCWVWDLIEKWIVCWVDLVIGASSDLV